jgi:glycosyltransferase involved in cell wall biosynthesis
MASETAGPKKGLDVLCRAWRRVAKQFGDVHLVIAGPNFGNTEEALKGIVEAGHIAGRVTFTGMLDNRLKWSALAASSLFVLPSHSEGFSVSVLEALAVGVPVVISANCNFPEVSLMFCGWATEVTEQQLEQNLVQSLALTPDELQTVGSRGRQLVNRDYSWSAVGAKMRELQNWILFGVTPSTVRIQ